MLLTYYAFLIAALAVDTAFSRSSVLAEPARAQMGNLLVAPLVLLVLILNLGFVGTLLLTVVVVLINDVFLPHHPYASAAADIRYCRFGLWLGEAIVPAAIHFAMRSRPNVERWSLQITAVVFLLAPIVILRTAADVREKLRSG